MCRRLTLFIVPHVAEPTVAPSHTLKVQVHYQLQLTWIIYYANHPRTALRVPKRKLSSRTVPSPWKIQSTKQIFKQVEWEKIDLGLHNQVIITHIQSSVLVWLKLCWLQLEARQTPKKNRLTRCVCPCCTDSISPSIGSAWSNRSVILFGTRGRTSPSEQFDSRTIKIYVYGVCIHFNL